MNDVRKVVSKGKLIVTCLKNVETVRVTGRKESKHAPNSSGDQLRLFSLKLLLSREPLLVRDPEPPLRLPSSKFDELCFLSKHAKNYIQ